MNNNRRLQGHSSSGDQSAFSLLVNPSDSRDVPREQREMNSAMSRNLVESLGLRSLTGDGSLSLEEQLFLQQQSQGSFPTPGSVGFLNQLREQNYQLSQLSQQQQIASLLGLGGGNGRGIDVRQALAHQMRQQQAAQHLTNSDILALSRSGNLQGLSNFLGGSGLGNSGNPNGGYNGSQISGYVNAGSQNPGYGSNMPQSMASELELLQRLQEIGNRQRLLSTTTEARRLSPVVGRVESSATAMSRGFNSEQNVEQHETPRIEAQAVPRIETPTLKVNQLNSPLAVASYEPEPSKEELETTSGSVRVPCRARGMPMDHNFKTAFFVIPENVRHGEELICSYFACRNAGIKFRYCSHCKVPVAKRNFRKRHKHGGDVIAKSADDDDESGDDDDGCPPEKNGIPSQITANREERIEEDGISSQSTSSTNLHDTNGRDVLTHHNLAGSIVHSSNPKKNKTETICEVIPERSLSVQFDKITTDRQQRWISLLWKRPSENNSDLMSRWLTEVIAVSDLETPLKPVDVTEDDSKCSETMDRRNFDHSNFKSPANVKLTNNTSFSDGLAENLSSRPGTESIIKKKRPKSDFQSSSEIVKTKTDSNGKGSFAEWKERKKQKKQSKGGSSS